MGADSRPLAGVRVLVTRSRQQAGRLSALLQQQGASVSEASVLAFRLTEDGAARDRAWADLARADRLILTSENAARLFCADMPDAVRALAQALPVAVVGEATAAVVQELGLKPDVVPLQYDGEALAEALVARGVAGQTLLLPCAAGARPALRVRLQEAGAQVLAHALYESFVPDTAGPAIAAALDDGLDWLTLASSETARSLWQAAGGRREALMRVPCASIGRLTSETLRQLGFVVGVEAATATLPALVEALVHTSSAARSAPC
jgi:uroporphyrinogen III methyltransferase/synthase